MTRGAVESPRPLADVRPRGAAFAATCLLAGLLFASTRAALADGPVEALERALASGKPEVRSAALVRAAKAAGDLTLEQRRKEALLLRKSIAVEPDSALRVATIAALAAMKDDVAWVPVVQATLSDRDDAVRLAATRAVLVGGADCLAALARLVREDQDETFRAEVVLLLGRRRREDAVPVLLEALADSHPRVVAAAAEALEAISGQALGYGVAPWKAWWAGVRATSPAPRPGETVTAEPVAPQPPPPPPAPRGLVPSLYGLPLPSKDLVFVVDVSGSIGDEGVRSAKLEILRAVELLGSDVSIAALFFDGEVRSWHPEMVRATPTVKAELARYVKGLGKGKRTDVMTALGHGLAIVKRRVEEKQAAKETFVEPVTMVVVSDGQENVRATPGEVIGDRLDRLDLAHTVVHAIAIGGKDSPLLAALARRGGGSYRVAP